MAWVNSASLGGVTCTHQPLQSVARNREDVVEVRDTADRQPLAAAEDYFSRKLANRSGAECNHDRTNIGKDRITGQDQDGPATHGWRQFRPPHFAAFHASSAFQSEIWGSSASNAACVSASSFDSTSVMAVASRYCRMASSTSVGTSRPCFAARIRSCSSTLPGRSILTKPLYPGAPGASTGPALLRPVSRGAGHMYVLALD